MKKRIVSVMAILALVLGTTISANAQIFLDDEDMNRRGNGDGNMDIGNIIPQHGVDWDQANYTPMGEGILLLSVLGGAYLLGKKRKEED
jgi:hypothetical protein